MTERLCLRPRRWELDLTGVIIGSLLTGGFLIASQLLIRLFDSKNRADDRIEWYRRTLFEKRLDAIQEGYHWLMRLNRATSQPQARTPGSEQNQAVARMSQEAREWYDSNCVFLEDAVPSSSNFIGALNAAGTDQFWKMCIDAEKDLRYRFQELFKGERESKNKGVVEPNLE
jgi:hypothetical protein